MTFDAALYRLVHCGTPGDVSFYRARCRGVRQVLELGCGDGRVAAPLAADGAQVVGVELHAGMLAAAEARRAALSAEVAARWTLVEADMADFVRPERFDRVIVPYTGLYCLDPHARLRCLRAVRDHLAPGGQLVFDVYPAETLFAQGPFVDDDREWIGTVYDGDVRVDVYERDAHDPAARAIAVTYEHLIRRGAAEPEEAVYSLVHHYLLVDELPAVLAAAGLQLVHLWGDFDGRPVDDEAERLIVVAEASD
ncbi:MAG: class I SAM-dependent methyltransferase [Myxococcales bacterium]|nr:class I SAM-dependent methyltransferase [Myxococcales bacterium]